MRKVFLSMMASALFLYGCGSGNKPATELAATADTSSAPVPSAVVQINNTYGRDVVVAMVQGALSGQDVTQLAWLKYDSSASAYSWQVPDSPSSNTDLRPYITTIPNGQSISIAVPEYSSNVGFRCLVADTVFKQNALQVYTTSTGSTNYMAFPDMNTATYVFDKFEAGLTSGSPGIWNITAVDFVAIPMQLSMGGTTVGFKSGVTARGLIKLLSALPTAYANGGTQAPNSNSACYRFFAPANVNNTGTALDAQITKGLATLSRSKDTVYYGNYTFFGFKGSHVKNGDTVTGTLTCNYMNSVVGVTSPTSITVNDVTTPNSFAGTIVGAANSNVNNYNAQGELGAILSAAICRGVAGYPRKWGDIVHTNSNCAAPWNYYPKGGQFDEYSNLIHSYSIDGKNYAFAYDDYFGEEAGFTAVAGDTITVNILPDTGAITAKPSKPTAVKTGCLVATTAPANIYPSGSGWQIGTMKVGSNLLSAGANVLCSLNSDTVLCTFPQYPGVSLKVPMNNTGSLVFSGTVNKQKVTGITGLVFIPSQRVLTFGQAAAWITQ